MLLHRQAASVSYCTSISLRKIRQSGRQSVIVQQPQSQLQPQPQSIQFNLVVDAFCFVGCNCQTIIHLSCVSDLVLDLRQTNNLCFSDFFFWQQFEEINEKCFVRVCVNKLLLEYFTKY